MKFVRAIDVMSTDPQHERLPPALATRLPVLMARYAQLPQHSPIRGEQIAVVSHLFERQLITVILAERD